MPHELDIVRLEVPLHGWPAGTEGTLVEAYEDGGIVEVDDDGGGPAFLPVLYADVVVTEAAARESVAH